MTQHTEGALVISFLGTNSRIQKRVGGALAAHGIGLSEYLVLNRLYATEARKMRRSDLAEQVGLTPSGITRLLNPMEKIGLLEKELNPRDARVSLVTLSPAGKHVYEDAQVTFNHASEAFFASLNSKQLSTFAALLDTISQVAPSAPRLTARP